MCVTNVQVYIAIVPSDVISWVLMVLVVVVPLTPPIYFDMRCSRTKDNDQIAARLAEVAIDSLSGQPPTRYIREELTLEELFVR